MGEAALLLQVDEPDLLRANAYVLALADRITGDPPSGVTRAQAALDSVLVCFNPSQTAYADLQAHLLALAQQVAPRLVTEGRLARVPVLRTLIHRLDRPRLGRTATMHFVRAEK